jgi:hypothetical protein
VAITRLTIMLALVITSRVIGFGSLDTGRNDGPPMGGKGVGFQVIGNTVANTDTFFTVLEGPSHPRCQA